MKKILKSELTPQLVKPQEATLQRLMYKEAAPSLPPNASAPDSIRLSPHKPGSILSSNHEN